MSACWALLVLLAPGTAAVAPAPAAAPAAASSRLPRSPLQAALQTELERAMKGLVSEGGERPYYASASVHDRSTMSLESVNGALLAPLAGRTRSLRVTIRVGSYELDNSGFAGPTEAEGAGEVIASLPLEDDVIALRRVLWLAFDEAYKAASATLSAKKSFLAGKQAEDKESLGDFTREEPRHGQFGVASAAADRARLETLASRLGAALAGPGRPAARLRLSLSERRTTFVDSTGSNLDSGTTTASLEAAAWADAGDGMPVRDLRMRYAPTLEELGAPAALEAELRAMSDAVLAQIQSPVLGESYRGPVLFEGEAVAQLLLSLLVPRLSAPREPLTVGGRSGQAGDWSSRIGSRVVSDMLSVADDPGLTSRGGVALVGGHRHDIEGVVGQAFTLIDQGRLRDFVGTRWPRRGRPRSTGHARQGGGPPWNLGAIALPSNLVVTAAAGAVAPAAARERFLLAIRDLGLPFGLLVRRLDDNSILSLGGTDLIAADERERDAHQDSALGMPVAIFRVRPDGSEERIRGARFGEVQSEALRDILAVTPPSSPEVVYNGLLTYSSSYSLSGPVASPALALSMVAPGVLVVEEVELRPLSGPFARQPLARARERAR